MRQELELDRGVQRNQLAATPRPRKQPPQSPPDDETYQEILAQARVAQPPLLLHDEQRVGREERRYEQPTAVARRRSAEVVHAHALEAAARRCALADEAVEPLRAQPARPRGGPVLHRRRQVAAGARRAQAHEAVSALEPQRLPRYAEAELDLRADRHQLGEASERGHELVATVATVEPHRRSGEAGRDADAQPLSGVHDLNLDGLVVLSRHAA